jgi:hypothetical protein
MPVQTSAMSDDEADRMLNEGGVSVPPATPVPPPVQPADTSDAYAAHLEALSPDRTVFVRDEKYTVVDELPGIVLMDLGIASDPAATDGERLRGLKSFLDSALVDEDKARFERQLRSARPVIGIKEIEDIIGQIAPKVTGRPT